MPTGIATADRKLLLGGGGLLILLIAASVLLAPPPEDVEIPFPSTYSTQSNGAAAAYRLLSNLHYPVRRWESPPTELKGASENTILVLAEPMQAPSTKERNALQEFVAKGGHVLYSGANIRDYFPEAELSMGFPDPGWKSLSPSLPTRLTRGVKHISMQAQGFWRKPDVNQLKLFGDIDQPVVVTWSMGDGMIEWWGGSTPLTNAGITREDNVIFFLNAMGNWDPDEPYQIYWDEYYHGQRSSLLSYIGKTSLAWSGLQIGLLVLAVLFTFSRRSGPVYVPAEASRLWPLEFVDTLGGLYERAKAGPSAILVSLRRLRTLLTRHLGLSLNTPNAELAKAAEARLGWKDQGLGATLSRAEVASRADKVRSSEALEIVRKLEEFTSKLDVRSQTRREKT
jgi:hypothetical protein